jgi:hypothetical protein
MGARLMDLTGAPPRVAVDVISSTCVEVLMSLTKFGMERSRETFEDGGTWFDEVRTKASPRLLRDLEAIGGNNGAGWGSLAGIALGPSPESPPIQSIPEFIAHLEATTPRDLWLIMAGFHLPPLRQEIGSEAYLRAADGNEAARDAILRAERKWGDELDDQLPILSMTPHEAKESVLSVLRL